MLAKTSTQYLQKGKQSKELCKNEGSFEEDYPQASGTAGEDRKKDAKTVFPILFPYSVLAGGRRQHQQGTKILL
jgi:hypothetical protein